jgi:hypothetical protein
VRLAPDGPDRSPWAICFVVLPMVLCFLMLWDEFKARRYRKYPWTRPPTLLSTVAEWKRLRKSGRARR